MPRRKEPTIPNALLDQLLAGGDASAAFDQGELLDSLKKALTERALNAEMDHHLASDDSTGNTRNGYGRKTVMTDTGKLELDVPRDREASFDPQLIPKYQRRFPGFDEKIVSMYARGMRAFDAFIESYTPKYEKAADCLSKDRDTLLAFYDFPAEHWKHLRTTNPIESTFATVRHRTIRSKGCLSNRTALAMVFKLLEAAQKSWRRLDGHNQLPKLVLGVTFNDGIEVIAKPTDRQPITAAA